MIRRFSMEFNAFEGGSQLERHPHGNYVLYGDHVAALRAALTVDDAAVERAWAMMMGRNCVVSYEGGDEIIDGADKDDLRAALTAALERAE